MEPQPKSSNKFAPEQSMSAEEWERIHTPIDPIDETIRQVIEANNLECAKKLYAMVCESTGIHDFVPYKPGTMICSRCGIFAKVGALYMQTRNPDDLLFEKEVKRGEEI